MCSKVTFDITTTSPRGQWIISIWYIFKALIEDRVNKLRLRQNSLHFSDDIFKCIFQNENAQISIKISLKFVPKGPINNIPILIQIMAWRRPGDKPLSESMMVSLLMYICVTWPQWVNVPSQSPDVRYAAQEPLAICMTNSGLVYTAQWACTPILTNTWKSATLCKDQWTLTSILTKTWYTTKMSCI